MPDNVLHSAAQKSLTRLTDDGEFVEGYVLSEVEPFSSDREAILHRIRAVNNQVAKKRDPNASLQTLQLLMSFTLIVFAALSALIGFILIGFRAH